MLNHTAIEVGNRIYKLRLTSQKSVELEEKLKMPLLESIEQMSKLSINTIITILHYSMQALEHGIKREDVYKIYDEMVEEGKQLEDFIDIINNIFEVSGFFPKDEKEGETERKNFQEENSELQQQESCSLIYGK